MWGTFQKLLSAALLASLCSFYLGCTRLEPAPVPLEPEVHEPEPLGPVVHVPEAPEAELHEKEPHERGDTDDDADGFRRSCEPSADAPDFRRLDTVKDRGILWGDCGELAWKTADTNALHYLAPDAEPREVSETGRALWVEGDRILYVDEGGLTLESDGGITSAWTASRVVSAGKVPGAEAFWVCSIDHGIVRLDSDGLTPLTPNFLDIGESDSGCRNIDASPNGIIAYPTNQHQLGVVDASTGSDRTIDHPFYSFANDVDPARYDRVRVSPDGALVFHEKRWRELIGDAHSLVGEGEITVFNGDASEQPYRIPGLLGIGNSVPLSLYGPWMGTSAAGVFVPEPKSWNARLVGIGEPISLPGAWPLAIRGNQLFIETIGGAASLDLRTGNFHHLMSAGAIDAVTPFRWGGPVAISYPTEHCVPSAENPSHCQALIRGLALWREDGSVSEVAFSANQYPTVRAIAPDGGMIVSGRLLKELPESAEAADVPFGLFLLDADGHVVRELDYGSEIVKGLGGEHFAILQRERRDDDVRFEELIKIDWKTGDETVLLTGRFITWDLDHSDRRVSAVITLMEEGLPDEHWSGVVAR